MAFAFSGTDLPTSRDTFNRANENPVAGWSEPVFDRNTNLAVISNVLGNSVTDGDHSCHYWGSLSADHLGYAIAQGTRVEPSFDGGVTLQFRKASANTGYHAEITLSTSPTNDLWALYRYSAGYTELVAQETLGARWAVGDYWGFEIEDTGSATVIRIHRKPAAGSWSLIDSYSDSAGGRIQGPFYAAVGLRETVRLDDFRADDMAEAGGETHFGAASLTVTAGITTNGTHYKRGAASLAVTAGVTTAGTHIKRGAASLATTFGATVAGKVTAKSAVALPVTVTAAATGKVGAFSSSTQAFTLARVVTGKLTAFGAAAFPVTFAATSVGTLSAFGAISLPVTLTITTRAGASDFTGAASLPVTFGATTAGAATKFGAVALPVTFAATTNGVRTGFGAAALPVTATFTVQGRLTAVAQVAFPITLTIVATVSATIPYTGTASDTGYGSAALTDSGEGANVLTDGGVGTAVLTTRP